MPYANRGLATGLKVSLTYHRLLARCSQKVCPPSHPAAAQNVRPHEQIAR